MEAIYIFFFLPYVIYILKLGIIEEHFEYNSPPKNQ